MAVIYVVHAAHDRAVVEANLLRPLPSHGFDSWLSAGDLSERGNDPRSQVESVLQCDGVIAVVSAAAAESAFTRQQLAAALEIPRPLICVSLDRTSPESVAEGLAARPVIPFTAPDEYRRALAELLPPIGEREAEGSGLPEHLAKRIEWNEEIFSASLGESIGRHDHNRADSYIGALLRHTYTRPYAYPPRHAIADLQTLRRSRQFTLMRRYGEVVLASGTVDATVRRLYAQSLIELKAFDAALETLNGLVADDTTPRDEVFEARGLIGRAYKQRYVDNPGGAGSAEWLLSAIQAYGSVHAQDPTQLWHGINAASCILRAHRDGVAEVDEARGRQIASEVLERIRVLERSGELEQLFDHATRLEALVVLDRYEEAGDALDAYLSHPDMHAFAVSSTHRQFDELLQLGAHEPGRSILEQLWQAVERYRTGGTGQRWRSPDAPFAAEGAFAEVPTNSMLVRVSDPGWEPVDVPDLRIHSRLGTVISAEGTDTSVAHLLKDPSVISIDESRPSGTMECHRSVPFIRVSTTYPSAAGPFEEDGSGALVAVIDDGIDVLHQAFLDQHGKSRIVSIWDQADRTGKRPDGFTYGTYHGHEDINGYLSNGTLPPRLGRNADGHGTHVASIAAGRAAGAFAGGVAPGAPLLIVISNTHDPIGYSRTHLDALSFIDKEATRLRRPVVVNVSQGMNAGAHDGRSALEVAFDEFSGGGRKPGRIVVKSAGNERHKHGHAKITLGRGALEELRWDRPAGATWPRERIEIWWNSANEFDFRIGSPSNEWTAWVSEAKAESTGAFKDMVQWRMQLTRRHIDNGDSQLVVELLGRLTPIETGTWKLQIRNIAMAEPGALHAWIERGGGAPSSFLNLADEEITLSIPGTAYSVITVGAVDANEPIMVGSFSSYGPTRDGRQKPDVAAPGMDVMAAHGGTDDGAISMDGTSMAAPHVAGAIALLLSRQARLGRPIPASTQIASALRQKTRNFGGYWDRGQGYGVIDVAALLAAF